MEKRKEEILKLITLQMDKIISVVPLKNFVCDFVLCVEKEEQYSARKDRFSELKVFVVEVNPFAGTEDSQ